MRQLGKKKQTKKKRSNKKWKKKPGYISLLVHLRCVTSHSLLQQKRWNEESEPEGQRWTRTDEDTYRDKWKFSIPWPASVAVRLRLDRRQEFCSFKCTSCLFCCWGGGKLWQQLRQGLPKESFTGVCSGPWRATPYVYRWGGPSARSERGTAAALDPPTEERQVTTNTMTDRWDRPGGREKETNVIYQICYVGCAPPAGLCANICHY